MKNYILVKYFFILIFFFVSDVYAQATTSLSNNSIEENKNGGTLIGSLSTSGPWLLWSYELVEGEGSADNENFSITNLLGNYLYSKNKFDYETQKTHSIRVRSNQIFGDDNFESVYTINILNVNEAPSDIALSANTITENLPSGTTIGTFSTVDEDSDDIHTYALVNGEGSADNNSFTVNGNTLRSNAIFDYETKASYTIRVETREQNTDGNQQTFEKIFTIDILNTPDENRAPSDIFLTPSTIAENSPAGKEVGTLSTTDPDAGDTHTYSFLTGSVANDNSSFEIEGDKLKSKVSFNFETKNTYSILVQSSDGQASVQKSILINVTNVNESPTDISLSSTTIAENTTSAVGTFSSSDPDAGDTHTYSLVSGAGSTDNAFFIINGSQLLPAQELDYESKNSYQVRVSSTDRGGLSLEKPFTINVSNQPELPVFGSSSYEFTIAENSPNGTPVGTVKATHTENRPITYAITAGNTSDAFQIGATDGNITVKTSTAIDFETTPVFNLIVRAADDVSQSISANVKVSLSNRDERPVVGNVESSPLEYKEGDGEKIISSTITAYDPENQISGAKVEISTGFTSNQDLLIFSDVNGITGNYNGGTLTLSGMGTSAAYQTALRNVRYRNTRNQDANDAVRTIQFSITDANQQASEVASRSIAFTAINDQPVLAGLEAGDLSYQEGAGQVVITTSVTVIDPDSHQMAGAIITISNNFMASEDMLTFQNTAQITGGYNEQTGTLVLSGLDTKENYQNALRSVKYWNRNELNPNNSPRTIDFVIEDSQRAKSKAVSRRVAVSKTNTAPILSGIEGTPLAFKEGDSPIEITSTITASDPDDLQLRGATIQIVNNLNPSEDVLTFTDLIGILGEYTPSSGTLTLRGIAPLASYTAALRTIKYRNTNSKNPSQLIRTVSFAVTDPDGIGSKTVSRQITIVAENDAPTLKTFTKVINEDNKLLFSAKDFINNFFDADEDNLSKIKITKLPEKGKLQLNSNDIQLNTEIAVSNLDNVVYVPNTNYFGADKFEWNGSDPSTYATANALVNITVSPVNDLPTISNIPDKIIQLGEVVPEISFTIGDVEKPAAQLSVSATSNNQTLLPASGIVLGGAGENRKIKLTPVTGRKGEATVTITVSDGEGTTRETFKLQVIDEEVYVDLGEELTICAGETITLKALTIGVGSPYNYTWTCDSSICKINNQSGDSIQVTPASTTVYYVRAKNSLEVESNLDSVKVVVKPSPEVNAGEDMSANVGEVVQLNATVTGEVAYFWTPTTNMNDPNILNPTVTFNDYEIQYTLTAIGENGCKISDTVRIYTVISLQIPNGITPNGDGANETWKIDFIELYPEAQINIFDEKGKRVFHSIGYSKEWDGTSAGKELPEGIYYYVIEIDEVDKKYSGSITIIR